MSNDVGVTPLAKWARTNARIRNEYVFETISEFLGTFVLCLFAVGASAQHVLMNNGQETFLMPVFGGVFGLMIAVTVFGGASGAHINPAVSLALSIAGELSWLKLPLYWLAQMAGGYLGAGLAYALYEDKLCSRDPNPPTCMRAIGIFSPLPSSPLGVGMADQIVATAILLLAIMSAIDPRNMKVPKYLFGIFFAFVVSGIAFAFGINAGGVLNPARDLGPRLMALTLGYDSDILFKNAQGEAFWLVPLIGPLIGGALGALIYIFFIGSHLRDNEHDNIPQNQEQDWRSTVFIPKAIPYQQSLPPQTPVATNNPYGNFYNGGGGAGMNNNGYIRENGKPQQIY